MKKLILSVCCVFLASSAFAQRCAYGVIASESTVKKHQLLQKAIENMPSATKRNIRETTEIIQIPVVVHIVHNNASNLIGGKENTNISNEQVFSQIKVLNEDFRKKIGTRGYNTHPVGADMKIEFFLAREDPDGNPTTGITRNYTAKKSFNVYTDLTTISNIVYWPSDKYLNIWVVDLQETFLGYGELPGAAVDGLELSDSDPRTDGVFIDFKVFGSRIGTASSGPFSYGRTLTHEIGHWLGLLHIWGDVECGTDYCEDTPQARRENDSETCQTMFSKCDRGSPPTQNMIENYMDYTPDSCMNIFTQDQSERVRMVLELSQRRRRLVLNSQYLIPKQEMAALKVLNHPSLDNNLAFQILLPDFQDFSLTFYNMQGQLVLNQTYNDYPSTVIKASDLNLPKGLLILKMQTGTDVFIKRIINF